MKEDELKNKTLPMVLGILAFLLALLITLYPVISNYVNERYASEIHTAYEEIIQQTDNSALLEAKKQAIAYNEAITPGTAGEAYSQAALTDASRDYESQLNIAGDGTMGYVEMPKISVNLPIYHGTGNDSLERGVGHLLGSSLPVGGASTHAILTGHSGMATQKMFTDLEQLSIGDVFYLHILDETLAYQVDRIKTVLPYDTSLLGITSGRDYCTLVTCTPYGINTHRLLVRGTRIAYEEAEVIVEETAQEEQQQSRWEEKYLLGLLLGVLAVLILFLAAVIFMWIRKKYIARQKSARREGSNHAAK
jgi:sortase A